jgi:hypothetical protein
MPFCSLLEQCSQNGETGTSFINWFVPDNNDWLTYWESMRALYPDLPNLAMFLLSVTVQSATCERIFKTYNFFHTDTKDRLHIEKTKALITIKVNLKFQCNFYRR